MIKAAVIYLRVLTAEQVNKGHDPEGYSISAQREACQAYVRSVGAEVVQEYAERGVNRSTTAQGTAA